MNSAVALVKGSVFLQKSILWLLVRMGPMHLLFYQFISKLLLVTSN